MSRTLASIARTQAAPDRLILSRQARRDRRHRRLARGATMAVLIAVTGVMLLPIYAMVAIASAPSDNELNGLAFHGFHLASNIATLLGHYQFPRFIANSLIVAGACAILDVILSGAAGYALARLSFPGRRLMFAIVVATLALSPTVIIVPVYVLIREFGWLNSYQGLILPSAVSAFGVFLIRQFALGLPPQLLHAARIDGASEWRIFSRIAVPLLRPALLTLLLLSFLVQWDNLIWPLIVANTQNLWTLPVGLAGFQGEHGTNYHLLITGAFLSIIPPMLLFAALQRYYVAGLTLGGLKK